MIFIEKISNLAELKQRIGTPNVGVELLGLTTIGDGNGGLFYWNSTSADPGNDDTIVEVPGVAVGRWIRITEEGIGEEIDPIYLAQKGQPLGAATLDSNGKLTATQFPNIEDTPSIDLTFNTSTNTLSGIVIGYNPNAWNEAFDNIIRSASFNVSTGDLTLTKEDGSNVITNLDFRYILQEEAGNFIQNQSAIAQDATFWILNDGRISGDFIVNGLTTLENVIINDTATVGSQLIIGSPAIGTLAPSGNAVNLIANSGNFVNIAAGGRSTDISIDPSTGVADFDFTPTVQGNTIWHDGNFPLNIVGPTNGQLLQFNGTEWVNITPSYITSLAHVHNIANAAGTNQFSFGVNEAIRFEGSGDTSVAFNSSTKTITITSIPGSGGGGAVTSYNGRTGGVVSIEGDYSLDMLGDVAITSPATNQILQYNGTSWVNVPPPYLTSNQTITLNGDVTGSGTTSITTTIANNAVTYAKMQDVTAARLIGRYSASAGDPQEISIGTGLSLNPTTGVLTATGSGGTVTSVGLSMPSIFSVSGSPVTTTGTLTAALVNQTANTFFGGPTAGGAAVPAFRALVSNDIPALDASKITSGIFPPVRLGSGTADNTTFLRGDGTWAAIPGGNVGTVTSVGLSLPSIFTVTGSPVTSNGTLTGSLNTQNANLVFAGPAVGVAAVPTFRGLVSADLPNSGVSAGTYNSVTVNAKGIVTAASNISLVPTTRTLTITGGTAISVSPSTAQDLTANRTWTINNLGVTSINGSSGDVVYNPTLDTVATNGRTTDNWIQITGQSNILNSGSGLELFAATDGSSGSVQAFNRSTSIYNPLRLVGGNSSLAHILQVSDVLTFDTFTVWNSNNHPAGIANNATFSGASVPATITSNAGGHITAVTSRTLTPANIGALAASDYITGSFTASGNGSTLSFDIDHTITGTPSYINVQAASPGARGISYAQALNNGSNDVIRVFYDVAPVAGTNNIIIKWTARL